MSVESLFRESRALEAFKYRLIRRTAEAAIQEIVPLVPTYTPKHGIDSPKGLEGFWKIVWEPGNVRLEHETDFDEEPYTHTWVKRYRGELIVGESCVNKDRPTHTEIVFNGEEVVRAHTWVNREYVKKPNWRIRRRIENTLRPKLPMVNP